MKIVSHIFLLILVINFVNAGAKSDRRNAGGVHSVDNAVEITVEGEYDDAEVPEPESSVTTNTKGVEIPNVETAKQKKRSVPPQPSSKNTHGGSRSNEKVQDAPKDEEQGDSAAKRNGNPQNNPYVLFAILVVPMLLSFCRHKMWLWCRGIIFLIFSRESKGISKAPDAGKLILSKKKKTIIFIRHGESDWNEIFNDSKVKLLPRLIRGFFREAMMFMTKDSVFLDSPLSVKGVKQAESLQKFLKTYNPNPVSDPEVTKMVSMLNGDKGYKKDSVLVSSNLRRAINTGCVAMWPRLKQNGERITILSSLQEMSRNVDTNAIADAAEVLLPEFGRQECLQRALGKEFRAGMYLDASESTGNKGLFSSGMPRMKDFACWCMGRKENIIIVSAGHSLWFKNFFKLFLPKNSEHTAKMNKMFNCSAVGFTLSEGTLVGTKDPFYMVHEESITEIYLGFEKKYASKNAPKAINEPPKKAPLNQKVSASLTPKKSDSPSRLNAGKKSLNSNLKEGTLEKKARNNMFKNWQTKTFSVVKVGDLFVLKYWTTQESKKTVPIEDITEVLRTEDSHTDFELIMEKGPSFCLRGKSATERDSWIDKIEEARAENARAKSR